MKRVLPLLLLASIFAVGIVNASPAPPNVASLLKAARAQVTVPPEWDGIWDTADSLYTCDGLFLTTIVGSDTLCGGSEYSNTDPNDITFTCTGTANSTTIDLTCTGSGEVNPGCTGDINMVVKGTRTSTTYFTVYTISGTYTGLTCDQSSSCFQLNSHGTKTGATTAADCVTPTKRSSWGELKILYR